MVSKSVYLVAIIYIFVILVWAFLAVLAVDPNALIPTSEMVTMIDWSFLIFGIIPIAIVVLIASHYRRKTA